MRPPLLIGLGNPLAGDDGIGRHVTGRLRLDPRLAHLDILTGDDLLRLAPELAHRPAIFLVDAVLEDGPPGHVRRIPLDDLDDRTRSAHLLPPAHAIALLRRLYPPLRDIPVAFLGIGIHDVHMGPQLSPPLQAALDRIVEDIAGQLESVRPPGPNHPDRPPGPAGEGDVGVFPTSP